MDLFWEKMLHLTYHFYNICTVTCGHLGLTKSWFQIVQMQVLFSHMASSFAEKWMDGWTGVNILAGLYLRIC